MFESRCGVCCESCERKEKVNCKGCINMDKPFWGGECIIKSCCEAKNISHCGVCNEFPCLIAQNFGKEEGFDPSLRIEQCKKWADN